MRSADERPPGSGQPAWVRLLRIGCVGCLFVGAVLVIAVAVFVVSNWSTIKEFGERTTKTVSQLVPVRTALQEKYDTPNVTILANRNIGADGMFLSVELVNPPFLSDLAGDDLERKAREIALCAIQTHPTPKDFDRVIVILTERRGVGVSVFRRKSFSFSTEELAHSRGDTPVPAPARDSAAGIAR